MSSEDSDTQHAMESLITIAAKGVYVPNSTSRHDTDLVLCPRCFDAAARPIFRLEPMSHISVDFWKRKMRTNHREFWIDLAALITQPRDVIALSRLGACLLDTDEACRLTTHNFSSRLRDTLTESLLGIICHFLNCVSMAFGHCFYQTAGGPLFNTIRFSAKGAFPTSKADMMPRGAAVTMHGLLQLWQLGFDASEFVVFAWLSVCWRELCPFLELERVRFLNLLIGSVRDAIEGAEKDPTCVNNEMRIAHLVELWDLMHRDVSWARRFLDGYHDQLLDLAPQVQSLIPRLVGNAKAIEAVVDRCTRFHARWKSTPITDPGTTDSDGNPLPILLVFGSAGDPMTNFHWIVKSLRTQLGCDHRQCQNYGRPGYTAVQRCSRCFFVRYCSRECQRAAWKESIFPHKEICAIYQAVPRPDVNCDAFVGECRRRGTSVDQLAIALYHVATMRTRDDPVAAHADFHIRDLKRALLEPAETKSTPESTEPVEDPVPKVARDDPGLTD